MSFMHKEAYSKWLATQSHEMQCYCSREQFLFLAVLELQLSHTKPYIEEDA